MPMSNSTKLTEREIEEIIWTVEAVLLEMDVDMSPRQKEFYERMKARLASWVNLQERPLVGVHQK